MQYFKAALLDLFTKVLFFFKIIASSIFIIFNATTCYAQSAYPLRLTTFLNGSTSVRLVSCRDSLEAQKVVQKELIKRYAEGFISASVDTLRLDSISASAYMYAGCSYRWRELVLAEEANPNVRIEERVLTYFKHQRGNRVELQLLQSNMQGLLESYYNSGYPFAKIQFDSVQIDSSQLSARVVVNRGDLVQLDSLVNVNKFAVSQHFLQRYLGFNNGEAYQAKNIKKYDKYLRQLPYLTVNKAPEVSVGRYQNSVFVYIENRRANKFDLLLALQPNSNFQNRFELTGEGMIQLKNRFKQGENIELSFKKITRATNQFKLLLEDPFLPKLPVGADFRFELIKRDSTFVDRIFSAGLRLGFAGNNFIKIKNNLLASTVLRVDTAQLIATKRLPNLIDYSFNALGLEFNYLNFNRITNPTSGWRININTSTGFKKIKKNSVISSLVRGGFRYESLYDTIQITTFQWSAKAELERFLKISTYHTIRMMGQAAIVENRQLFRNEWFRVGGFKNLRGFDEDVFQGRWYAIATLEYRFIIGNQSALFAYVDQGLIGQKKITAGYWNRPTGVGAGINFETKAGILTFAYGVGRLKNTPFQFRNSKIHFGYVNYF